MAGFDNQFFLGVAKDAYVVLCPPKPGELIPDAQMLEFAALVVTMKPKLREQFNAILRRMEE